MHRRFLSPNLSFIAWDFQIIPAISNIDFTNGIEKIHFVTDVLSRNKSQNQYNENIHSPTSSESGMTMVLIQTEDKLIILSIQCMFLIN